MREELREAIRQTLDDEVLSRTGRSVGDLASGYVTDALLSGPLAPLLAALQLIDRNGCENLTRGRCSDDPSRTRDSDYTSTQWCPPCIAAAALDGTP